jgi:hypothetical protein
MAAKQVKKNAEEAGIADRTLKRAKRELGVRSEKESDGSWTWSLPDKAAERGRDSTGGILGTVGPLGKDATPEAGDSAHLWEEGQGCQEGQGDHQQRCIHDILGGKGCYLCDPQHPYRLETGAAK